MRRAFTVPGKVVIMMERSIINITDDRLGAKSKERILCRDGLDEDETVLLANLYLINAFEPLFRDQDSLVSHFRAHIRLPVKWSYVE
jgi:hypothetical protein